MEFIHRLLFYVSVTALIFLLLGLYKPWVMLWWEDVQNRRKVLWLYGSIATISYALYAVTFFLL
jgi:hypothetical protein